MFSRSAFDRHRSRYFPFAAHVSPQPSDPRTRVPRTEPAVVRHCSTHAARPICLLQLAITRASYFPQSPHAHPRRSPPPTPRRTPIGAPRCGHNSRPASVRPAPRGSQICNPNDLISVASPGRISNSCAGQHSTDFHLTALLRTPTVNQNRVEPRTR